MTRGWRRALAALALAAALAAASAGALGCGSGGGSPSTATTKPTPVDPQLARKTKGGPNFLVVLMDDQAENSFRARYMPQTFRWIVDPGTLFRDGLAAPPLCCPDRAGFLTGGYPHNSGVFSNHPGYSTLKDPGNTLPVWLARAGYRTALIGKYLNHYYGQEGAQPAPGWDRWFAQTNREQYYDYPVSDDGAVRQYGSALKDYSSQVFSSQAARFIDQQAGASHPFFLWLTYNAPHGVKNPGPACGKHNPQPPKPSDARRLKGRAHLPRPPSFNEADVSDKPTAISRLPRLGKHDVSSIQRNWRCTLATMSAADNGVGRVMRALKRSGQLDRTIVFYMSDNGFYFGEHRIISGKQYPYEPGLRVPYAVRVPSRYRSRSQAAASSQVVSEQDATATILDYAGVPSCATAKECRRIDGRRMQPLLGSPGSWPVNRGVLAEIKADQGQYSAIRTRRWVYVLYDNGEKELYDLKRDPYQLQNVAGEKAVAPIQRNLAARLASLRRCSGARGIVKPVDGKPLCE